MVGPANPFSGPAQKNGTTGSAGRGRGGSSGRVTPYQPQNPNAPGDPQFRGRGRGRGASSATRSNRDRGRGAGTTGNTWRKPETPAGPSETSSSPFAQLKQKTPFASPFGGGGGSMQQKSQFSNAVNGSPGSFGAPSKFDGTSVDSTRDPRLRFSSKPANGTLGHVVPVEDVTVLNRYNDRYEQLKLDRAKQREKAIKEGQMADPNQPTSLNQAITPVGTCTSMCPEFERVERIVQKMVDKSEKFLHPSTNSLQNMEMKMLKRFRRSAAGYDEQLPSDIRTPKTLLQTINYLIRHVLGGSEPLGLIHKFVWDRTRSIRNDFSVQQLTQEDDVKMAVTCLERIARFHIVSLHLLSSPANEEPFDRHQEREQLNNTMLSLMYYYDDNRGRISFPNEDEFRAYYIIFSIHDQRPDLEARVQKWPAELRNSPRVQAALELFAAAGNTWEYQGTLDAKRPNAIAQGFYARFFRLVDSPAVSYLMACVAEIYFNHMRQTAIRSIWKAYCRSPASQQHKNEEWTVGELTAVLYFDDDDQTVKFCEEQDLEFAENANGDLYLDWGSRPVDSVAFQPSSDHAFSEKYVESKRVGRTLIAIILGLNIKEAANLGMIDSSLLSQRSLALQDARPGISTDDDALFVSDDDNEMQTSSPQTIEETQGANSIESPASASRLQNAAAEFPQTTATEPSAQSANFSFSPAPSISQPSESTKPFSSLFSVSNSNGAFPAPAAAPANPFANMTSSFTSFKTPETTLTNTPFSKTPSGQQSSSVFSTRPSAFTAPKPKDDTTSISTTPRFKLPSVFQPTETSPAPFNMTATPAPGLTAGQPSTGLFNPTKPPAAPTVPSFKFTLSEPDPVSKDSRTEEPQTTLPSLSQEIVTESPPPVSLAQPSNFFAPKKNDAPFTLPESQPASAFKFAKPAQSMTPEIGQGKISGEFPQKANFERPGRISDETVGNLGLSSVENQPGVFTRKEEPLSLPPKTNWNDLPDTISDGFGGGGDPFVLEDSSVPLGPTEDDEVPTSSEVYERRYAWLEALKEAADRRRQTFEASRKRVLDEEPELELSESEPKVQKISKPEAPISRKVSMALSSIKPLPKLPILEQIEKMTARKPAKEEKPEVPKPTQVDEDELLLSAARIAAESLRSGPKLLENWSAYPESRRPAFSPGSSISSQFSFSRSQSPQSYHVHGYDVALAPDTDLGLGRTLSRTEQRIRLTGGKGLAYKPLDFTPEKQKKRKDGK